MQRILSLLAAGFCFMAGVAGYHQVMMSQIHYPEAKKAVYVNIDNSDLELIDQLTLQVPDEIKIVCAKYGNEYGIDPELLEAIAWRESRWTANVVSENGTCKGLMQINEKVHGERMKKLESRTYMTLTATSMWQRTIWENSWKTTQTLNMRLQDTTESQDRKRS